MVFCGCGYSDAAIRGFNADAEMGLGVTKKQDFIDCWVFFFANQEPISLTN